MAMTKAMIPRPPIHCMKERQKSRVWGAVSRDCIMVNAVPVHPAIPSKNASVKLMLRPSMNGIPHTIAQANQKRATEQSAVESRFSRSFLGRHFKAIPRRKKMTGTVAMGRTMYHSEKSTVTARGTAVRGAIKKNISPMSAAIVEI